MANGEIHKVAWDSLLAYGRLEWQWTLTNLEKTLDVAYKDVLKIFDNIWCVKGLIATHSNLVVTLKARPCMGIIS